jgi:oligopeptide transport system ATP-binding protein
VNELTDALRIDHLKVSFPIRHRWLGRTAQLRAIDDVSLAVRTGEALGLVGESGCGKSTLARAVLQLIRPTSGSVVWLGRAIEHLREREMRPLRRDLQIIFQDPLASLDPRMTVGETVAEPLRVHRPGMDRAARRAAVSAMLTRVGLNPEDINRYPHEFSGGQCQRIGIARAMVLNPKLLICDEPVSALDVSIQAQIINLLRDLRRDQNMTILFVSHNLAVVRRLCDRVAVLYLGKVMELATVQELFAAPLHPYTRGLLASVPIPDPARQPQRLGSALAGELPSPLSPPSGCVFRTRCPRAVDACAQRAPELETVDNSSRSIACLRWREPE